MMRRRRWIRWWSAMATALLLFLGGATATVLSAEERVIYMAAVEAKGAMTVDKEPFPAAALPAGAGYVRKAPDPATGRWEVSVYHWSPATAIVRQGDDVTIEFVRINSAAHPVHIERYHPEHVVVKRGEATRVRFTVDAAGLFEIHCPVHEPTMMGYLLVLPR
jgi:plastocyanin